ncbi:TonB-dependent receptor [Salinisphaera sp. SPP-AMP-43]|uniref:TonB-dependent receptor plug domain-containing protein n=1 Tax=Salinisphaera sp. SPP-AMP-43 TaxID=3121288 RepID=UPI003C6DCFBE
MGIFATTAGGRWPAPIGTTIVRYRNTRATAAAPAYVAAGLMLCSTAALAAQTANDPPAAPAAAVNARTDDASPAAPAAAAAPAPASSSAAAAEATAAAAPVDASAAPATQLGDIAVTGTAIARTDAATALPVTTLDADALQEQGITSTAQLLQELTDNSTSNGIGASTGNTPAASQGGAAYANLRGLGPSKTLVLLNGRRLGNNAFNGGAVDLNTIPFAAIDRVEILRDGASAIYGTDAIGGVINFITKKDLDGGSLHAQYQLPTRDGGGNSSDLSASFGKGNLKKDGWNVMAVLSHQEQDAISTNDRGFVKPLDDRINFVSSFPYPANYYQGARVGNPAAADGCSGPGLVPGDGSSYCYFNFTPYGTQVQQKTKKSSFFGRGAWQITPNHQVSLSYLWSHTNSRAQAAPAPSSNYPEIQPGTRFYPGNGVVPDNVGLDASQPVSVRYRAVPLGPRITLNKNDYMRAVMDFRGHFGGFHYDSALSFNQSQTDVDLDGGNTDNDALERAFNAGLLNPFSTDPLSDQARAALNDAETVGRVETDKGQVYTWDGKLSHQLGDWFGAGASALALGAQYRHETLKLNVDGDIARAAPAQEYSEARVDASRNVEGVYGELNVPILKNLELDAAARYDNYEDVGDTVNPKVSLRYQPWHALVLRASYSEGFHAPTLYDLYRPQVIGATPTQLDDPVLCPGGNPAAGGVRGRDCSQQFDQQSGGNPDLAPEKSKSWSAGFVLQPVKYVSLSVDFWAVELTQQISQASPTYIFNHYDAYADRFVRNDDGAIDYYQNVQANLGKTETNGEDVQLHFGLPTDTGTYTLDIKGTYINKYDSQQAPGADYIDNVDNYANGVIFRWKHKVTLGWHKGAWAASVINHFQTGYHDYQPSPDTVVHRHVNAYVTWDALGSYRFEDGIRLTVGSKNILDRDPPFSIQTEVGNAGYDSRYAGAVGRTVYARLDYAF